MIKQPSDKVLAPHPLCSFLHYNQKRKTAISHWYSALNTTGLCGVFSTQVNVQSIKWISCKSMYKGYRRALLPEHSGDPTKQVRNVLNYFFQQIWLCFGQPKNWFAGVYITKGKMDPALLDLVRAELNCLSALQRRYINSAVHTCSSSTVLYVIPSEVHHCFSSLSCCSFLPQQSFTHSQPDSFSSTRCSPVSTLRETLTVWFSITLTDDLNTPPPQWFLYLSPSISLTYKLYPPTDPLFKPAKKAPTFLPLKKQKCMCRKAPLCSSQLLSLIIPTHTGPYIVSLCTHTSLQPAPGSCVCVCFGGVDSDQWHPTAGLYPEAHWQCFSHLLTTAEMGAVGWIIPRPKSRLRAFRRHTEWTL